MADQAITRRRRASRLHPVRLGVLTLVCLLLSGTAGAVAYFFPVVVAGVGQTGQTVAVPSGATARKSTPGPKTNDDVAELRSALRRLPSDVRLTLVLRYYLDLPFAEIGRVLKCSPQAAKSRTHQALAKLRVESTVWPVWPTPATTTGKK